MPRTNQKKDYYKILGVSEDASNDDIKRAYRKLAQKWHPDRCDKPEAEEKFKEIGEAYAVLKDSEKRKQYDQFRKYGRAPGAHGFQFDTEGFDFFDLFQQVMGGRPGGHSAGGQTVFGDLFGNGGGSQRRVYQRQPGSPGPFSGSRHSGTTVKIKRRIPFKLAALGGKLTVNTPSGEKVKVKIKPGTQPGTQLKIPGRGGSGRDLLVELDVKIPTNLNERQKKVVRKNF
ncbi:MAG: DnaJ domain-containing protein [bacterium]